MQPVQQILLIDDEEKLRNLMAKIISLEGFHVMQAENLKSAEHRLIQQDIDVVICDVKLPDGNGIDFIQKIKELRPLAEIILLTAYGTYQTAYRPLKKVPLIILRKVMTTIKFYLLYTGLLKRWD